MISVIIPVYNGADQGLKECLNSVAIQNFKDLEVIVIDDASTDNSGEIILDFVSKYGWILLHNEHNQGLAKSLNRGINTSKGDYVLILQQDSMLLNEKVLAEAYSFMNENKEIGILVGRQVYSFDKLNFYQIFTEFRLNHIILHAKVNKYVNLTENKCDLIRREALDKIGNFDTDLRIAGEDHVFSYNARKMGIKLYIGDALKYKNFLKGEDNFKGVLRKEYIYGYYAPKVIKKTKVVKKIDEMQGSFEKPKVKNRALAVILPSLIILFLILSFLTGSYIFILPIFIVLAYRAFDIYYDLRKIRKMISELKLNVAYAFFMTILVDFTYLVGFFMGTIKLLGNSDKSNE